MKTLSRRTFVFGCLVLSVGLALWRPGAKRSNDASEAARASIETAPERPSRKPAPVTHRSRTIERPFLVRPPDLFVAADEDAARKYRRDQAKELFGTLRGKLAAVKMMSLDKNPESVSVQMNEYLSGWVDGVVRSAPDLADELASEVQDTLCKSDQDPALMMTTFRLVGQMPELASDAAFDCVFSGHKSEDVVLWSALDAWRASQLPKSAAIAEIERNATDERTRAHLLPHRGLAPDPAPGAQASAALDTPQVQPQQR